MLKIYRKFDDVVMPKFETEGSACFDLKAYIKKGTSIKVYDYENQEFSKRITDNLISIWPGDRVLIPTGLIFDIPDNHVVKIYSRSSVAFKKGLTLSNSVGIIDSDYINDISVLMSNNTNSIVYISDGERIAQALMEPVLKYELEEIADAPEQKTDRAGGIGSTGTH